MPGIVEVKKKKRGLNVVGRLGFRCVASGKFGEMDGHCCCSCCCRTSPVKVTMIQVAETDLEIQNVS